MRRRVAVWLVAQLHRQRNIGLGQFLVLLEQRLPAVHRFIVENLDWQTVREQFDLLLELPPAGRPAWTREFLATMLHYAGDRSEELFAIMQGQR